MYRIPRREFLIAAGALVVAPFVHGQPQGRPVRIGALGPRQRSLLLAPVLKRLGDLGYVEGKNLVLEYRSAEGVVERFPALARELVQAKCDLIFSLGTEHSARALLEAKSGIPVVILAYDYDPVKAGIVASIRQPGGNITGMYVAQSELAAKRLELLHEIAPRAKRLLVLADVFSKEQVASVRQAAEQLRVELVIEQISGPVPDFAPAFARGRTAGVEALMVLLSPVFFDHRAKIFEFAMKHQLPSAGFPPLFLESGFVISYGVNPAEAFVRAGDIARSILNGKKPGDIALEQPERFELGINIKSAKAVGLTIPQSILLRADRVIE
jgi:putative ABC transport system substrate-binding protein